MQTTSERQTRQRLNAPMGQGCPQPAESGPPVSAITSGALYVKNWRQRHPEVNLQRKNLYKVAGIIQERLPETLRDFNLDSLKGLKWMPGPLIEALRPLIEPDSFTHAKMLVSTVALGRFNTLAFLDLEKSDDGRLLPKFQRCLFHEKGRPIASHGSALRFHVISNLIYQRADKSRKPPFALALTGAALVGRSQTSAVCDIDVFPRPCAGVNLLSIFADLLVRNGWDGAGYGLALAMPIFRPAELGGETTIQLIHLGWGPWGRWFDRRRGREIEPGYFFCCSDHHFHVVLLACFIRERAMRGEVESFCAPLRQVAPGWRRL